MIKNLFKASNTKKFTVSLRDLLLSFYYAIGASIVVAILPVLQSGHTPTLSQIKVAAVAGIFSGCQHIVRKFLTNSEGVLLIEPEKK